MPFFILLIILVLKFILFLHCHLKFIVMENIKIANEIRFVEIQIFPPQDEIFYCLLKNGHPTQYIFSEKYLFEVLTNMLCSNSDASSSEDKLGFKFKK